MTSDDLFEQGGVWYKKVSMDEARRIQFDIQLYFDHPKDQEVEISAFTPEERRVHTVRHDEWEMNYWRGPFSRNFCVRVDAPKPEYECEQPT